MNKTKSKRIKIKSIRKNKTMKGGQIVQYSTNDYNIFFAPIEIPISEPGYERMDCVANVFFGLGYCTAENAQYLAFVTPYGLEAPEIIDLIETAYEGRHQFVEINDYTELNDILAISGIATVACMSYMEDGIRYRKHCVGLLREENPEDGEDYYYIIDFQNEQILMIDYYMWYFGYNDLLVLDSDTIVNMHEYENYGRITEQMIHDLLL